MYMISGVFLLAFLILFYTEQAWRHHLEAQGTRILHPTCSRAPARA